MDRSLLKLSNIFQYFIIEFLVAGLVNRIVSQKYIWEVKLSKKQIYSVSARFDNSQNMSSGKYNQGHSMAQWIGFSYTVKLGY